MVFDQDYDTLKLLFTRSNALPNLRASAIRLVQRIDSGSPSAAELERVIAADPALTAKLIKAATSVNVSNGGGVTTIRGAILHLGHQSVRSIAISLAVQGIITEIDPKSGFDVHRFARHSLFVGVFSAYLMRRRLLGRPFETQWTPEELFAAGVLHDLPEALLYRVSPDVYARVAQYSRGQKITFTNAFYKVFKQPLSLLGVLTINNWRLPQIFADVVTHVDEPWMYEREYTALCCLNYADYISEQVGFGKAADSLPVSTLPDVEAEVGIEAEELATAIEAVGKHVEELHFECLHRAA